ncbi:hypothetical protein Pan258_43120 [Symmachiella dynata]|uniref:Uncharacterized protein n=1 Tax=Symmachiella dynata TaxID=2527995 RepID=A0A517ZU22_9PLAN|nr:hypothetical protein [Symmachiella dynata]QDT50255.1 hypothetical protein Pan258_43120 [Symmachiella dynata]QDU45983.1 hypothetical protein Mal52_44800 [Symmachiella dynata]
MVKEARFSFPVDEAGLSPRDLCDDVDDDLDDLVDDHDMPPAPASQKRTSRRQTPIDKRTDRRHLAGADWLTDADFLDEE